MNLSFQSSGTKPSSTEPPSGRSPSPEDVARRRHPCFTRNLHITGASIISDGGLSLASAMNRGLAVPGRVAAEGFKATQIAQRLTHYANRMGYPFWGARCPIVIE